MHKTRLQPANDRQIRQFLENAKRKAVAARKNLSIDPESAYQIAYEAMIKGSLAWMLSHNQRPRHQLGHHVAIIEFAQKSLVGCSATTFVLFDRMRRKRNDAFYGIAMIGDSEAKEAVSTAEAYLAVIGSEIETRLIRAVSIATEPPSR
jgi:hypothetical protein